VVKNRKNVGYFTIEVWWPVVFNEPLCAAIVNNETVRGVDFEKIIREIYSRVSPSACTRDEFVSYPHVSREGKSPTPMAMAVESYGYFLPAKCGNGVSQGKRRFRPHGDGGGRVCDACYKSAWRAKQPAFTCRKCGTKIAPGKRSYPHGEGGGGRMCNACGQRALRAKQQKR